MTLLEKFQCLRRKLLKLRKRVDELEDSPGGVSGNLYTENGNIPNGSNRSVDNSNEGLLFRSSTSNLRILTLDGNTLQSYNNRGIYSGIQLENFIGITTLFAATLDGAIVQGDYIELVTRERFSIYNTDSNGISKVTLELSKTNYKLTDITSLKRGLQYFGFGELPNDLSDVGENADYSGLVNNSLTPKRYVDELFASISSINLFNSNGTIPNGSNRTIINSSEGLKIVDQNYPDNYTQFINDYDNAPSELILSRFDMHEGIKFNNAEEGFGGFVGVIDDGFFAGEIYDGGVFYLGGSIETVGGIRLHFVTTNNTGFTIYNGYTLFQDNTNNKKGILLLGFGESNNDDTGNTADYSTLVRTSVAPVGYVDDNAGAKEINDLSDGIYNAGTHSLSLGVNANPNDRGHRNTSLGYGANESLGGDSRKNTAIGYMANNAGGNTENTAIGDRALVVNAGSYNTAVGHQSMMSLTNGYDNTAIGKNSMVFMIDGSENIAIGESAMRNSTSGNYNIVIGKGLDVDNLTGSNQLNIGNIIKGDMTSGSESVTIPNRAKYNNVNDMGSDDVDFAHRKYVDDAKNIVHTQIVNQVDYTLTSEDYDIAHIGSANAAPDATGYKVRVAANNEIEGRMFVVTDDAQNSDTGAFHTIHIFDSNNNEIGAISGLPYFAKFIYTGGTWKIRF